MRTRLLRYKKGDSMRLTKVQLLERMNRLYDALTRGEDEADLMNEFNLTVAEYDSLKSALFEDKSEELRTRPTEHTYVQYVIDQMINVKDLTEIIDNHKDAKTVSAAVSAIKVRSDIVNQVIAKGQECGVIHREADKKEIVNAVANLTSADLKKALVKELAFAQKVMKEFGDMAIIDIEPGEVHVGPAHPELMLEPKKTEDSTKPSKYNRAKNSKRSGGRVVQRKKTKVRVN